MIPREEMNVLDTIERQLKAFVPDHEHPDDDVAMICIGEAIEAARDGNFGVGAVLVDPEGDVVITAHNQVFHPFFRSDMHAEMGVVSFFETNRRNVSLRDHTLFTSLEPCPMCMARLITAGCGRVVYVAEDSRGGMVHLAGQLPPAWQEIASRIQFERANCSENLRYLAQSTFLVNVERLDRALRAR